jgi:hypothetical protein
MCPRVDAHVREQPRFELYSPLLLPPFSTWGTSPVYDASNFGSIYTQTLGGVRECQRAAASTSGNASVALVSQPENV